MLRRCRQAVWRGPTAHTIAGVWDVAPLCARPRVSGTRRRLWAQRPFLHGHVSSTAGAERRFGGPWGIQPSWKGGGTALPRPPGAALGHLTGFGYGTNNTRGRDVVTSGVHWCQSEQPDPFSSFSARSPPTT